MEDQIPTINKVSLIQTFQSFHLTASFSKPSYLDPTPLKSVIEYQPRQISDSHIPHGSAGCDKENEEVLFLQFDIFNDQRQFHSGEKEDHTQNRARKDLKKETHGIAQKETGQ